MKWEWLGSDNPENQSGTMSLNFSSVVVIIDMPNSKIAHILGQSISREIRLAREQGRRELSDEIRKTLEPQR